MKNKMNSVRWYARMHPDAVMHVMHVMDDDESPWVSTEDLQAVAAVDTPFADERNGYEVRQFLGSMAVA